MRVESEKLEKSGSCSRKWDPICHREWDPDEPPLETAEKTASKNEHENELRWKRAAHCRIIDTTNVIASGNLAYPIVAPRKALKLRRRPAFQRAS